jgi:hypothetical protein
MADFLNNPVAVGMSLFGLFLLIGTRWQKWQSDWERKRQDESKQ